jgi:NADPH-dependent 2,4-dienoyl-CoA reductase/sulfur reductase-like enzyme/nitrite reductase/ring-hydroxylating ferredoxin subunit
MIAGRVGDKSVLLARRNSEWFAVDATCTHYGGPLAEGLMVGDTVRCPWHHACFDLRTGTALRPPALKNLGCWRVEQRGDRVYVSAETTAQLPSGRAGARKGLNTVVIVGAGAAGESAAQTLRAEGYAGRLVLYDGDPDAPYDRPNLSKDYLAGTASDDWIPLHPSDFYRDHGIEIVHNRKVVALDPSARLVRLDNGAVQQYEALLLATGATPVRLPGEMEQGNRIHYLRSFADSKSIIAAAGASSRAVVLGGSFIGLEVAASLRARNLEVHVVAPETRPLERVMGSALGEFIRKLHEEHGVIFHLGQTAKEIRQSTVTLQNGERLQADLVVAGIGVRPAVELAERAGLTLDRGVVVDGTLQTSAPGIYAAGDIARWPDPHTGERIRVEHWVVAQRQGQTAARNILGQGVVFDAVPFFWSQHYDVPINYVGHAEKWDRIEIEGDIDARDCALRFTRGEKTLALATIYRDRESLEIERQMEQLSV